MSPPSLPTHDCLVYHVYSTLTCTVHTVHCTQFLVSGDTGPLELGSCTTVSLRPHHIQDTGEKLLVSSTRYLYHLALISSNCCYISTVEAGISTRISTRPTCQQSARGQDIANRNHGHDPGSSRQWPDHHYCFPKHPTQHGWYYLVLRCVVSVYISRNVVVLSKCPDLAA